MKIASARGIDIGTTLPGPLYTKGDQFDDYEFAAPYTDLGRYSWFVEDFRGADYVNASERTNLYDFSPAGAPTAGVITGADGIYRVILGSTNEQQQAIPHFGLNIPGSKKPWLAMRFRVPTANITTNELVAFGLATAITGDVEGSVKNVQFLLDGSMVLKYESDDGTTDAAAASTGITLVKDTWYWGVFDLDDLSRVSFQLATVDSDGRIDSWREVGTTSAPLMSTNPLAIFAAVEKTTGPTTPAFDIDQIVERHLRSA